MPFEGGLSLDLELQPGQTDWQFDLHHKGKLNLGRLIKAKNQQALSSVPVTVEMRMNAVGASVPQLLRSADGRIELVLGAGQLDRKASKLPFGGVVVKPARHRQSDPDSARSASARTSSASNARCCSSISPTASPPASAGWRCKPTSSMCWAAAPSSWRRKRSAALQDRQTHRGRAQPARRRRPFIIVDGTLKHPRVTIDKGDLLVDGAAAWATGGLSLVADQLVQRLTAFGKPLREGAAARCVGLPATLSWESPVITPFIKRANQ
jgi:hypothetical protein